MVGLMLIYPLGHSGSGLGGLVSVRDHRGAPLGFKPLLFSLTNDPCKTLLLREALHTHTMFGAGRSPTPPRAGITGAVGIGVSNAEKESLLRKTQTDISMTMRITRDPLAARIGDVMACGRGSCRDTSDSIFGR
ncbi:hypothetical protein LMH87_005630 [Akanthomyces muscarius]|uniref:Uncharacterized protein n=1 Tax=Akanthomyces muscarius TaxID=2231603 RepID=A0A9W8UQR7_AKAMU|nr:hypothetical protein LMH87_005630 [Akanthomyces muscarius]KAJ4163931.1 hypothetical protein LMH87_005630 [Akanthomyces muscarius]